MPPALYALAIATVVIGITEFAVLRDRPVRRSARLHRSGDRLFLLASQPAIADAKAS